MDHKHVLVDEPLSLIQRQTKYCKRWECDAKIMPEQAKKWCNKPTKLQLYSILSTQCFMLLKPQSTCKALQM